MLEAEHTEECWHTPLAQPCTDGDWGWECLGALVGPGSEDVLLSARHRPWLLGSSFVLQDEGGERSLDLRSKLSALLLTPCAGV